MYRSKWLAWERAIATTKPITHSVTGRAVMDAKPSCGTIIVADVARQQSIVTS
jgi:hypothetical protein